MIAVDTNILVYAHRSDAPFHARAFDVLRTLASDPEGWTIPWACINEFYGLVTNPRLFNTPSPPAMALDQIDAWMESPTFSPIVESDGYFPILRRLLLERNILGSKGHDARIYAVCMAQGVAELWSADRDFSRFSGLAVRNPLV